MFQLPEAKRVRREEIISPPSSHRSSPEIIPVEDEKEAHARLAQLLAYEIPVPSSTDTQIQHEAIDKHKEADEEEEFEFRLFNVPKQSVRDTNPTPDVSKDSAPSAQNNAVAVQKLKIRIRSPSPDDAQVGDGRFVVPFRGWRYYFTKPELMNLDLHDDHAKSQVEADLAMRRRQFEDVALTRSEVLKWAKETTLPGCHLPWRVLKIDLKSHRVPQTMSSAGEQLPRIATERKSKSKPGKKRRIILRTRAASKAVAAAAAAATSNMTEAEKRNKKNRERKIKRRQKERERKAALAATEGGDAGDKSDDSS